VKPVTQTVLGGGEDGKPAGNCFRACLASVIECDIDSFPEFENMGRDWWNPFQKSLGEHGYMCHGFGKPEDMDNPELAPGVDGYIVVSGGSPRGYSRGHAVIYKDGEMVHDPHPSREGITGLNGFYMIEPLPQEEG